MPQPIASGPWPKSLTDNPAIGRWLSFGQPGEVTVFSGKVELGQRIAPTLIQVASRALGVSADRIRLVAGDTHVSPNEWYTAGSQSVEVSAGAILAACQAARRTLLDIAAERLSLDAIGANELDVRDGFVIRQGETTAYSYWSLGDEILNAGDAWLTAPDWASFTHAEASPVGAGSDIAARIRGGAFIHDLMPDGVIHARIVRQPHPGARLVSLDQTAIEASATDIQIVRDGDFLAVLGNDEWQTIRASQRVARSAVWSSAGSHHPVGSTADWLGAAPAVERIIRKGNAPPASGHGFEWRGTFSRQPLLHASIGPSCALAQDAGGVLTVWTHSQGVFQLRSALSQALRRTEDTIRVIHVPGAGCYGHNGADDAACDAALLAMRRSDGRVVRVVWSREDEFASSPLGPPMLTEIDAALDEAGRIARWTLTVTSAPHGRRPGFGGEINLVGSTQVAGGAPFAAAQPVPAAIGGGAERNADAIYDLQGETILHRFVPTYPLRTSSMRALGAHLNVVAIEGAMDALAELAGQDPVAFRLAHLSDVRARAVIARAAALGRWDEGDARQAEIGSGRAKGFGFARYKNKAGLMAVVVEVEVEETVRLIRADAVVDCGVVVNRDGVLNQVEGGIIQAASFTLREEARIDAGINTTATWEDYPILGFADIPDIRIELIETDDTSQPLGVGEVATGPVSAAIVNAASRALGVRLKALPITRDRILEAFA